MMDCKDLFLTSEERYEVYCVKSSERPHLLGLEEEGKEATDELPLIDGCDIAAWRREKMVSMDDRPELMAALNVGLGCPLLRRETQIPVPHCGGANSNHSKWDQLRQKLLQPPTISKVERVTCQEASRSLEEPTSDYLYPKKYFSNFEEANVPVIITRCTDSGWDLEAWKFSNILKRYHDIQWRFSDTHGAMMSLKTYSKYIQTEGLLDDSPLAVYDSEFGDDTSPMNDLVHAYTVPPCFSDDLFALAVEEEDDNSANHGEDNASPSSSHASSSHKSPSARPPWRWILMGPPRSGTGLHIDPLWTNAWVTLLEGIKRWILIPPRLLDQLPEGAGLLHPQVPSVIWFQRYYDAVVQLEGVVEVLQLPGSTVFVPNGWPHLVLNLQRTVAVTHNYASEFGPFERMWQEVAQDEPEFAQRWYKGLCHQRPDLAARIQSCSNHLH